MFYNAVVLVFGTTLAAVASGADDRPEIMLLVMAVAILFVALN